MGLETDIGKPYYEIPCSNNQPWHIDTARGQISFSTELDAQNAIKLSDRWASQTMADIREEVTTLLDRF